MNSVVSPLRRSPRIAKLNTAEKNQCSLSPKKQEGKVKVFLNFGYEDVDKIFNDDFNLDDVNEVIFLRFLNVCVIANM